MALNCFHNVNKRTTLMDKLLALFGLTTTKSESVPSEKDETIRSLSVMVEVNEQRVRSLKRDLADQNETIENLKEKLKHSEQLRMEQCNKLIALQGILSAVQDHQKASDKIIADWRARAGNQALEILTLKDKLGIDYNEDTYQHDVQGNY